MQSKVYLAEINNDTSQDDRISLFDKLIDAVDYTPRIKNGNLTAIKTHFGEQKQGDYIHPCFIPPIAKKIKERGGIPFLTETSVLYKSVRDNAPGHTMLSHEHGFGIDQVGIPTIMLDGLRGNNEEEIEINAELLKKVKLAADISACSHLVILTHVTGHIIAGMGAALKNMGMGLSSRKGKLQQHSGNTLQVMDEKCTICGACFNYCPVDAITPEGENGTAIIDEGICIGCGECLARCRFDAIKFGWDTASSIIQKRIAEYALGAYLLSKKNMVFFNFLIDVTKDCDCLGKSQKVIPDIGILASLDPVAIDMASLDLIKKYNGKSLEEMSYKSFDASIQIKHAEKIGLGSSNYIIMKI